MKKQIVIGLVIMTAGLKFAFCEDEKISIDQVPEAAKQSLESLAAGNKIVRVEKEEENGATYYEALVEGAGDKKIEYSVTPDGTLNATEEKIRLDNAPAAVAASIKSTLGSIKVKKLEKVTKNNMVTYEVEYKSEGEKKELVLSDSGKVIKNEADKE